MGKKLKTAIKISETKSANAVSRKPEAVSSQSVNSPVDQILSLQRTIGNQAVQRLFQSGALQPKLKIGQPNDRYEQEADRVADQVMCMLGPDIQRESEDLEDDGAIQPKPIDERIPVQAKLMSQVGPEEEGEVQAKSLFLRQVEEDEEEPVQTKAGISRQSQVLSAQHQEKKKDSPESAQIQTEEEDAERVQARVQNEVGTIQARGESMLECIDSESVEGAMAKSGAGRPLESAMRTRMEQGFGTDFSGVRIHTNAAAEEAAQALNARAFTRGVDVYFARGKSPTDSRLMAHELTHVVQQGECNLHINRREAQPVSVFAPAFSVVRGDYEQLVRRALQNLSGRLPRATTFISVVQPILQSMLAQVVWRDSGGSTDHGGGSVTYAVPGERGVTLNFTMVLDDLDNPSQAGQFQYSGTDGLLFVRVRRNTTVEELTEVLYHESMHMMSWIINNYGGAAAVPGVERRVVRGLEFSCFSAQISGIRRELDSLALNVNARRCVSGRNQITANQLGQTALWLMEEVQVRAETEVFQQALQVEKQQGARARLYIPTRQYGSINLGTVSRYVFEFSRTFTPEDRRGITEDEQQTLRTLTEILEGFFQFHVRRRFSLTAHTMTIPRTRPEFSPRPLALEPPSFIERIEAP